jgi:hypothetical protein
MALWGRLGGNSDNHPNGNIPLELFEAVMNLWITGDAAGGLTNGEALAALNIDAGEQTEANRLKAAMNALASDAERRAATNHIRAVMNLHELDKAPLNTGALVEQSLVDWFAANGVTF